MFKRTISLLSVLLLGCSLAAAQDGYFGKNKVSYKSFGWQKLETSHFDVYYYQQQHTLASVAARIAENAFNKLSKDLGHTPKERIPLVLYASHNDFEQTNTTPDIIEESVGAFTTVMKNRVVVPYTGSYADLNHVISHELTHAFMFDLFLGGSASTMMSLQNIAQLPLWFAEGLAEFESQGWDPESEMFIKDLAVNQRLVPIPELGNYGGGYIMYKEGQSIVRFIAAKYGQAKVSELLHLAKTNRNLDKSCKQALGVDLEKLSEDWEKDVHKAYWPFLAAKKEVPEVARQLTRHDKNESYFNLSPCFSPEGDKIAYISDQGGYAGLYVISSIDGHRIRHIVKGEKTSLFESMHLIWFRGGLCWSPDGKQIAFAAKSSTGDRLYIVDAGNGRVVKKLSFDLDGIYFPNWSPLGDKITFCGLKNGRSDLYISAADGSQLQQLTSDLYDDREPAWSPDGTSIVFASDRTIPGDSVAAGRIQFGGYRLFTINVEGDSMACVTPEAPWAVSPSWSRSGLIYVTYRRGIPNIGYKPHPDSAGVLLTDVLTGCFQPKWSADGSKIAFTGYHKTGWDIYTIKNPIEKKPAATDKDLCYLSPPDSSWFKPKIVAMACADTSGYAAVSATRKFSIDWAAGTVGYSTYNGISGQLELSVSDILGDHLFYWRSGFVVDLENSDYQISYLYLPKRLDYGISLYQDHGYYRADNGDYLIERLRGAQGLVSYPFSRFQRLDLMARWDHYQQSYYFSSQPDASINVIAPALAWVTDNTLWGYTGPMDGQRALIGVEASQKMWGSSLAFVTGYADLRRYWRLSPRFFFATRLMAGASKGKNAQLFDLGGPYTLHGYEYGEFYGTRIALTNLEFRFPLIDRLDLAFPPMRIRGIRGAFFVDLGAAWTNDERFQAFERTDQALLKTKDLRCGLGGGLRVNLYPFLLKIDFGLATDL
ncbi:MAG: BamA/TamA family outer membrane protein, partial [Candidatus Edwardsbacteria bacterium]|nr:BamA/TamA family outer membrane protein [Candidatus Edwardsbacteria bacterium]